MAVVLDDLPPLMWHAELGRSLPDVWAGEHRRGAQLHDLRDAVQVWSTKYHQRAWFRQLQPEVSRPAEDAVLRTIARMNGTPFPSSAGLITRWVTHRGRRPAFLTRRRDRSAEPKSTDSLETAFCAEIVAMTYQAMGLLSSERSPSWFDPGRFWSGDELPLIDARLGTEIAVNL